MSNPVLKKIIAEAKRIRKAHPKKFVKWTDYVKEASKKIKPAKNIGNNDEGFWVTYNNYDNLYHVMRGDNYTKFKYPTKQEAETKAKKMNNQLNKKVAGWKKGTTRIIERKEKPVPRVKNVRVLRTSKKDLFSKPGTFNKFVSIQGVKFPTSFVFEYKVSRGGKYYVSTNLDFPNGKGVLKVGNGSDHKRNLQTYLFTNIALKKFQKLVGKEKTVYIESDF